MRYRNFYHRTCRSALRGSSTLSTKNGEIDGEAIERINWLADSNYLMFSDHLHFWQEPQLVQEPRCLWEFVQIDNCSSRVDAK
ncbi:MAG TPA: hypothetical protein ENN41_05735 [Sediminispirochaeta sp.]|nr:hypothetical protein [Sediminispirochaeta sp.]